MSEIALDRTVWSGFRLSRKHPAAFGLWVIVDLALGLGPTALIMALLGPNFFDVVRASAQSETKPDTSLLMGLLGRLTSLNSISLLATWVLYAMLYAAIFRAVLRPQQNRWGYLRLGKDEFLLFILIAMFYIGFVALLAMAIFVVVLLTALAAAASQGFGLIVGVVLTLACGAALIWLAARLSMVLPMSFDQGRIRILEAWDLSRGHVKELLLLAVLLVVLGVAIAAVLFAILTAAVGAFVASYADAQGMATFMTQPTKDVIRELTPWGLAAAALSAIVSTFGLVIFTAPWAEAYRQIMGGAEHQEEVF
ncbi:MAG TPA: hypothetical protein VFN88_11560 [Caulobacteraceae bacterium]|nr:hypothetical protein [Caulobacteraceae bacterium]